jgi:CHASE3 domain sensor protein
VQIECRFAESMNKNDELLRRLNWVIALLVLVLVCLVVVIGLWLILR